MAFGKVLHVLAAVLLLAGGAQASTGFIRTSGLHFVDDNCQEFIPRGAHVWQLMEAAAANTSQNASAALRLQVGTDPLGAVFNTAVANNFTIIRFFAHGVDSRFPLQPSPGVYNEDAFKALDTVIARASSSGVKLIMSFADNWRTSEVDSKGNYLAWAKLTANNSFFTDPTAIQLYENHISTMANRTNTITGIKYANDPAIFAWDIMNEPRCDCSPAYLYPIPPQNPECLPTCADIISSWINTIAPFAKRVLPNQLLTVGQEGFWGQYAPDNYANPGNGWANLTGNNFTTQQSSKSIDFTAVHMWPTQWSNTDPSALDILNPNFVQRWLEVHAQDSAAMNKPFILEEFGVEAPQSNTNAAAYRQQLFQTVYQALNSSVSGASSTLAALRGVNYFQFSYLTPNPFNNPLQVASTDTAFINYVAPTTKGMSSLLSSSPVGNCTPTKSGTGSPAPSTPSASAAGRRLLSA